MGIQALDVCLLGLALYLMGRIVWRRENPLPPGPPGWPLIGNLIDFSMHAPHKKWGEMCQKYGKCPIMSLRLMGTQYVVFNSHKVAKGILEKKSMITSNRPHFTMGCDLVGLGDTMPFLQFGDTHRKYAKFFHQQIGTRRSLEAFYPVEEAEAKRFIRRVLQNPDDLWAHCHRMAGALILQVSHGYTVKEDHDPFLEMAEKVMDALAMVMTPGHFIVDMVPILRYLPEWFPGGGFHRDAVRWRKMLSEASGMLQEFVLERLADGEAAPSFMSRALQENITLEEMGILKWASFSMYLGGAETTPPTISAFFLAMTMYPEVLKKAQAEMDTVVGYNRLPTCQDRDSLPYVNAICMELLRWHSVGSFAIHVSTEDIVYEGHFIPKGSFLLPNMWFMLSDPETYPNPDIFSPERFLGEDRQPDPREVCFGWGRRSCPGARLAELTIFTYVATALATLDVSRCIENGVEYVPRYDATEGIVRYVKPFKCRILPRSKKAEDLLRT